jgi:RND superfamily putative drug exporter
VEGFLERLGRLSVRFRWVMVALWLVGTVAAVHLLPALSSVVDTQNSAFLPADQPSIEAAALEAPFQSTTTSQALIVASAGGRALTAADGAAVLAAEHAVSQVAHVASVKDLATSANGNVRLASVEADVPVSGSVADAEVAAIRAVLHQDSFGTVAVPDGLTFNLTGALAVSADNAAANKKAQEKTELFSYLIIIVILLLVYRSALAWLINLIPAGIVLALSEPVVGVLAQHGVVPASPITPVMMTVLVLGAGTDYGLFLIMRFREEMESGLAPHDAVVAAMRQVGESVVYAGLTVSGALFCLTLSSFGIYKGLGPALAIGILLMLVASVTLTPALLALSGRATFWPSRVRAGTHEEGLWGRVAERCARRPAITLAVGVGILGILALGCIGFTTTGFSGGNTSPARSDSAVGSEILDANFSATVTNPTNFIFTFADPVWTSPGGLDRVAQAQTLLTSSHLIDSLTGPLNPIGSSLQLTPQQLATGYATFGAPNGLSPTPPASLSPEEQKAYQVYRATAQFVSPDGRTVQFATTLSTGDPTDDASVAAVPDLRTLSQSVADQVRAVDDGVYGIAAFSYDVKKVANQDLLKIFPIVALVIGILLALLLRSLVAPVFLLLSVGISYFSTLGITNLIFVHWGDQEGINFVLPFMLFVFLVALGEDYNILVMSRIREETLVHGTEAHGTRTSVTRAVGATGTTVTSAGIILAGTFGAVGLVGGNSQLEEIGIALAIGILLDTFLVRTLLVPSTVQLLGRWTWWPSALGRAVAGSTGGGGPDGGGGRAAEPEPVPVPG